MLQLTCVSVLLATLLQHAFSDVLVNLPDGTIRGLESKTLTNKTFYSFRKIPFATPPVGNLRFKAPIPPKKWTGVLDATSNSPVCYQVEFDFTIESEDCLYLNVYTPQLPSKGENTSFAVMFWIYGGGFTAGNALPFLYGPEFFVDRDVIIVTANYRLGPFGFLSTQDTVIPGNNGLKDQQLAIKWTHDNIRSFGGDPEKITIFGESTGSSAVSFQLLHKRNEGLFRGAILQSGTSIAPWSLQRNARNLAFQLAALINSTFTQNKNSDELHRFLLSVSADQLDKASLKLRENLLESFLLSQDIFYAPVIEPDHEGAFLTEKMYSLFAAGRYVKVPIIIGMNSEEGLFNALYSGFPNILKSFDRNVSVLVPLDMKIKDKIKLQSVGEQIRRIYTNGTFADNIAAGVRYHSDQFYTRSIIKNAELQSRCSKVYFYQFSYDGKLGNFSTNITGLEQKVAHAEDLNYMWHVNWTGFNNTNIDSFPRLDVITQNRVLRLWTDFAKTLNPTPKRSNLLQNIIWPCVNSGKPSDFLYLDIDKNLRVKNHPRAETYSHWTRLYRLYGAGNYDTY